MKYEVFYGHEIYCTPGILVWYADNEKTLKKELKKFVCDGYRNGTWISCVMESCVFTCNNKHGKAVCGKARN